MENEDNQNQIKQCRRCHCSKNINEFESLCKKGKFISMCLKCQVYKKKYFADKYSKILKLDK